MHLSLSLKTTGDSFQDPPLPQYTKSSDDQVSYIKRRSRVIPRASSLVAQLVKKLPAIVGDERDMSSSPGLGRSPGEGNGNLFQYFCLENSMDGGAWQDTVHEVTKSRT